MSPEVAFSRAEHYLNRVKSMYFRPPYTGLIGRVLADPRFRTWPASTKHHHVYNGGLLVHTAEVTAIANGMFSELRPEGTKFEELILAAILHDYMKVHDYVKVGDTWEKTEHARRKYHIVAGALEFRTWAGNNRGGLYLNHDHIEHIMLAHHGLREWGSPVEPQTPEAYILHAADMLSLKAGRVKEDTDSRLMLYI